jgi:hypothetical protein
MEQHRSGVSRREFLARDCAPISSRHPTGPDAPRPKPGQSGVDFKPFRLTDEVDRARLIQDIACLLHEPSVPETARAAGLELIGWLARRMPGEPPHALGVEEATRQSIRPPPR